MPRSVDGPATNLFSPVTLKGNTRLSQAGKLLSPGMRKAIVHAPAGACVCHGVRFAVGAKVVVARDKPVTVALRPTRAPWLLFLHTADRDQALVESRKKPLPEQRAALSRVHGPVADYVMVYDDGTEARVTVRRKEQISAYTADWGRPCNQAVSFRKQHPVRAHHEQTHPGWGWSQTRVSQPDMGPWVSWVWAWENQSPDKKVVGLRIEPRGQAIVLSAVSAGDASSNPLRWRTRRKAVVTLPSGMEFDPRLDEQGLLKQVRLDLGQVISAELRSVYDNERWPQTYNNKVPERSKREVFVEYTSHEQARFHLPGGKRVEVTRIEGGRGSAGVRPVPPSVQRVTLRVVEKATGKPVAVKLHVHGAAGEYLAPLDRHRIPNDAWYEDWSVDFVNAGAHRCTYVPGETRLDLPLGPVYVEISKGFEIRPVRTVVQVTPATSEITLTVERVLPWRQAGWVTADTHVHFLSPASALLEGAAEGVNIVNLLASQWGELMTNVGDFDGRTTWGSKEAGGDGEYLVRVGTENRQHVLGHISLLGYEGPIIAPMTTGGPDESALGDPVETLLTEWARQCKKQNGVVIIPHFPFPRCEHAATIVSSAADGVEMTAWGNLYGGIDPNSLVDWYRYLNCGYFVAAVGGTDKMSANTAVGTVRTYARLAEGEPFTYGAWKNAVRRGATFVTYGPLVEFAVDGKGPGSRIAMGSGGGTVDIVWNAASVTVPMSRVELVVNGEIRESQVVDPGEASGRWRAKIDRSSWLALLVRGHYADKPEIVAAHTSPVMVALEGSQFMAAADAMTILEQIEGALAYVDTSATRAQTAVYKRLRLVLTSIHRELHNRMHQAGHFHEHAPGGGQHRH